MLKSEPEMLQKNDRVTGDEFELYFTDDELTRVVVAGHALIRSPRDTTNVDQYIDRLYGDKITLDLKNRKLERVLVEGKATSYYHVIEEAEYKGLNKVIGDKITMYLKDNEIQRITFESDPGVSDGIYYPPTVTPPAE